MNENAEHILKDKEKHSRGDLNQVKIRRHPDGRRFLAIQMAWGAKTPGGMSGLEEAAEFEPNTGWLKAPLTSANAAWLREHLPWLNPQPVGLATSFGFGDRLGLATPGHVQALGNRKIAPIFAQQSVRENERTKRNPQQVIDEACWGLLEEGWQKPWGADADHIKDISSLEPFFQAGYTFFTLDPGDHVRESADQLDREALLLLAKELPWDRLGDSLAAMLQRYTSQPLVLRNHQALVFDEIRVLRAAVKYGAAIAHARDLSEQIQARLGGKPFDLEISVDETEAATTPQEHAFIASELRRLGAPFNSLAPRFPGRFEKGVDYIGDLATFEADFALQAGVMHTLGGYKISIHSGSDKFSLYSLIARYCRESPERDSQVHVKTAGTSYLEALRVIAVTEPDLFRQMLDYARACYPNDRASYHVSAELEKVPPADALADEALPGLLDQFDARQVLHVTFGSLLKQFGAALHGSLQQHSGLYAQGIKKHFERHLDPIS